MDERERKSFLVNNNPQLHFAHGIMQKDPSHSYFYKGPIVIWSGNDQQGFVFIIVCLFVFAINGKCNYSDLLTQANLTILDVVIDIVANISLVVHVSVIV